MFYGTNPFRIPVVLMQKPFRDIDCLKEEVLCGCDLLSLPRNP